MKRYFVITGTVTYAIKARDIFKKNEYYATLKRISGSSENIGCGYGVITVCEYNTILKLLSENGIKYLKITEERSKV